MMGWIILLVSIPSKLLLNFRFDFCTGRFAIDEFAKVFDGFSVSSSLFETSSVDNMLVDLINILITLSDRIKRFNSVDTGS
jgi:hypothetical protein